jgi:hypothetical protein
VRNLRGDNNGWCSVYATSAAIRWEEAEKELLAKPTLYAIGHQAGYLLCLLSVLHRESLLHLLRSVGARGHRRRGQPWAAATGYRKSISSGASPRPWHQAFCTARVAHLIVRVSERWSNGKQRKHILFEDSKIEITLHYRDNCLQCTVNLLIIEMNGR